MVALLKEEAPVLEKVSSEVEEETGIEEKKTPLGIPIPETLLLRDVKIEVFFRRFSSGIPAPVKSEQIQLQEKMDFDVLSIGDSIVVTVHKVEKKPSLPIEAQKPEEKIEAVKLKETEMPNVLLQLLKKAHPMVNGKRKRIKVYML